MNAMIISRRFRSRFPAAVRLAAASWAFASILLAGCSDPFKASVVVTPSSNIVVGGHAQLGVSLENPPQGLRFVWHTEAGSGTCDPQESTRPYTTFVAPEGIGPTTVLLSLQQGARVRLSIPVVLNVVPPVLPGSVASPERLGSPPADAVPAIKIESLDLPYDPVGSETLASRMEGTVFGVDPARHQIVLYVLTDKWYVQPLAADPFTPIGPNGEWATWIHSGKLYAALLVDPTKFRPRPSVVEGAFMGLCREAIAFDKKVGTKLPNSVKSN